MGKSEGDCPYEKHAKQQLALHLSLKLYFTKSFVLRIVLGITFLGESCENG
jgi:hypothetical protein